MGTWKDGQWLAGAMTDMKEAELKVTLALYRLTLGFHRSECAATKTFLMKMTGLSWPSVHAGIRAAIARGTIVQLGKGANVSYALNIDDGPHCKNSLGSESHDSKEFLDCGAEQSKESLDDKERITTKNKKERVARELSPAVACFFELTGTRANRVQARLIDAAGLDIVKWRETLQQWMARGWSPRNVPAMLERYNMGFANGGRKLPTHVPDKVVDFDELKRAVMASGGAV